MPRPACTQTSWSNASTFFFCGWLLLLSGHALGAATQIDGFTEYSLYSSDGTRTLLVRERFSAFVEGKKWFIATELLSVDPPLQYAELPFPPYQELGSDGGNIYLVKMMPNGTNLTRNAYAESGTIPNMFLSPSACIVWLAFCSGSYLSSSESAELKPIWGGAPPDRSKLEKCTMAVSFERNREKPEFLDVLNYLCDGRQDPCNPSREKRNLKPYPWREGYTQAVFRVESPILTKNGSSFPGVFKLDYFGESYSADFVGSDTAAGVKGTTRLRLASELRGTVTNISSEPDRASWLPELENKRLFVNDHRFTARVTNWSDVRYPITNEWLSRTNALVEGSARMAEQTRPYPKPKPQPASTMPIRIILVTIFALSSAIAVLVYLKKYTNRK